ncbi:MAG: hypothetical protein IH626_02035 [Rhodospirillales bacterium]|nr:hypothetical protein [Rhodospirillales bacterium]
MNGGAVTCTLNELMASTISRMLYDGELGFVGIGTAGRAFTLAVGIPIVAARLAQMRHAPDFTIYWGNLLSPDLDDIPESPLQDTYTRWPAAAALSDTGQKLDMLMRGDFDVSFESAAQVDQFGNLNITLIGDPKSPRVRLVGCLAQPEHLAFVRRPIIVCDLNRRTFVEKVDFITSVGHGGGTRSRRDWGLPGPGPWAVVTDKAVFDFDEGSGRMRLRSLHPGVTPEEICDLMAFTPIIPAEVGTTPDPDPEDLRLIREKIDCHRMLIRA